MLRVAVIDEEQFIGRIIDQILDTPGPSGVGLAILHESATGEIQALPVVTFDAGSAVGSGWAVRSGST